MYPGAESESLKSILVKTFFFAGLIVFASGYVSPPIALTAGILFGLGVAHRLQADRRELSRFLLQGSDSGLGFGMNVHDVVRACRSRVYYTDLGLGFEFGVGRKM